MTPSLLRRFSLILSCLSLPACYVELDGDLRAGIRGSCSNHDAIHTERFAFDAPITAVVVDNGVGDISVRGPAPGSRATGATVETRIHGDRGRPEVYVDGQTLHVGIDCSGDCCAADLELVIPGDAALSLEHGVGDVLVSGLRGRVELDVGVGDLELEGLHGPLDLHTGTGEIDGHDLASADTWADVGTGDIALRFDASTHVESLAIDAGVGSVYAEVPRGRYALHLDTGVGDISISGLDDAPTGGSIAVDVGTGDIELVGR